MPEYKLRRIKTAKYWYDYYLKYSSPGTEQYFRKKKRVALV